MVLLVIIAGTTYYQFVYRSKQRPPAEVAYVLPDQAEVVDTTAEIRLSVAMLKSGDRVEVLSRSRDWAKVKLPNGRTGWMETDDLLDQPAYEGGQRLLHGLASATSQATGNTAGPVNLRLEPSREAALLAQLLQNEKVEVFDRRVVARSPQEGAPSSATINDVWYLVRADSRAGWVLGKFVNLDIPEALSRYAQNANIVAWLVLNTVDDEGRKVPQYLVADRSGALDEDFTRIRVFTWSLKSHQYVTAYAESRLNGHFPIRVTHLDGVPYFRLRLLDKAGDKLQRVYGLFNTITRPVGTVEGWESDALPAKPEARQRRRRR